MVSPRDSSTLLHRRSEGGPRIVLIRVLDAAADPKERRLRGGAIVIGAGAESEIVIESSAVSRKHAQVEVTEEGVFFVDLGSRNGSFVDGHRVERIEIRSSTVVTLGNVRVAIDLDESPRRETEAGTVIAKSTAMQRALVTLEKAAPSDIAVLLLGESGSGKEVAAQFLHARSRRSSGPFVAVNCGALERNLARSELFGHRRGAFTGAAEARTGAFEVANGGTLFLDEVGELPLEVQPLLLRALETSRVVRVGETDERPINVRVIAATNRSPLDEVKEGRFRSDLYFRLSVLQVRLPALRERRDDIAELCDRFAAEFGAPPLPDHVLAAFLSYDWPGNVRELRNVIRAYAAVGIFPEWVDRPPAPGQDGYRELLKCALDPSQPYHPQKAALLERFLAVYVELLLERTQGNQSEAARISGLDRSYINQVRGRARN